MSRTRYVGRVVAIAALALPVAAGADGGGQGAPGSEHGGHGGHHSGHGAAGSTTSSLSGAWAALTGARDAIAKDVESGALDEIHAKAERLPGYVATLLEHSDSLDTAKRARVEGAAKQVQRVADALHMAADGNDAPRTRKELKRLYSLLDLIRAQYPAGALVEKDHGHEGHSWAPAADGDGHGHGRPPLGVVEAEPAATLRVRAFDPFRFEPARLELQAGVATRIELENAGATQHALVVRTPGGGRDWIHLHVGPGETQGATYRLDEIGTYPVVCTIPGHAEGGMIGELVVSDSRAEPHVH